MKQTLTRTLLLSAFAAFSHGELSAAEAAEGDGETEELSEDAADGEESDNDSNDSESPSSPGATEDSGARPSPLELALGAKIYSRAFRYTDTLAQLNPEGGYEDLVGYNLDAAPMPFFEGSYFPLASSKSAILQNIGLTGSFEMGVGTNVAYGQNRYDQTHYRFFVGLRGRIPVGPITLNPLVGYGGHQFSLGSNAGVPAPFPNVSYSLIEMGMGAEWRAKPIVLRAQGRFLLPVGVGDIKSDAWFPNASALGAHFGGQVGFIVSERFTILATFDARTYGFNFNPIPPGTPTDRVAGGAVDRYIAAGLAIEYRIPEKAAVTATESSPDKEKSTDDFDLDF